MSGSDWLVIPVIAVAALIVLRKLIPGRSQKECSGCSTCSPGKTKPTT